MKSNFDYALNKVFNIEGGYVNDKDDSGGKTNLGVTESLAREYGYKGDMKDLDMDTAKDIYKKMFWDKYKLDLIKDRDIASEVFEFGINAGMKIAIKTLQRAYNALNDSYILLTEDGSLGPKTADAINSFKGKKILLKTQNILQGMYYIYLAEGDKDKLVYFKYHKERLGNPKNKRFIKGWINKRIEL